MARERPTRFFLDTHEWDFLVDGHWSLTVEQADELRQHLIAQAQRRQPIVCGSVSLLQEILPLRAKRLAFYNKIVSLMFDLIGPNWLKPLNQMYVAEALNGGLLTGQAPFLPLHTRRDMRRLAATPADVEAVAEETRRGRERFVEDQAQTQASVKARLTEAADGEPPDTVRLIRRWWENLDIADWVRDATQAGVDRGHIPPERFPEVIGPDTMPTGWHFMAFKLARIKMNLGEGEKVKASDYTDAEHYASAVYTDVLVTEDQRFTKTADLLADGRPFIIETFEQFAHRFV